MPAMASAMVAAKRRQSTVVTALEVRVEKVLYMAVVDLIRLIRYFL